MGQLSPFSTNASPSNIVDKIIGNAYTVVRAVYDKLNELTYLAVNSAAILEAGNAVLNLESSLGYAPPVPYGPGIVLTQATQTVEYVGIVYAPLLSALPFTTGEVFDNTKFRLVQGVAGADLASTAGAGMLGFSHAVAYPAGTVGAKHKLSVNVMDAPYNAVGNNVASDHAAFQAAIDAVNAAGGGVVLVPDAPVAFRIPSTLTMYAGVELRGIGHSPVLDYSDQTTGDFIQAVGTKGTDIAIASAMTRYDKACASVTAHSAAVGDQYVLVSQRNALSADAGEWQLGLGTGSISANYFAEILEVSQVTSTTVFAFTNGLIFPDYKTDSLSETQTTTRSCTTVASSTTVTLASGTTTGLIPGMRVTGTGISASITKVAKVLSSTQFTMTAAADSSGTAILTLTAYSRPSATIAKVNFLANVNVAGLTFIAGNGTNTIRLSWCKDSYVDDCVFLLGNKAGLGVYLDNCYRSGGRKCQAVYANNSPSDAVTAHNPAYNAFKVASSWFCGWNDCSVENASQPFDITYNSNEYPSLYSYVLSCRTNNAKGNAMTAHSGSYGCLVSGCSFLGASRGPALRSRNTTFTNNIVTGAGPTTVTGLGAISNSYGVALPDGWVVDSVVSNNQISGFYHGIFITDGSSQGTGFTERRTLIASNVIRRCTYGVYSSYDEVQSKTTSPSGLLIQNNLFSRIGTAGIWIDSYLNAAQITNNQFIGPLGGAGSHAIYIADNVINTVIRDNSCLGLVSTYAIRLPVITDTVTFPSVTYPHAGTLTSNNTTPNDSVVTYSATSVGENNYYRNGTPLARSYNLFSGTTLRHEWSSGNGVWSVGTANTASFVFYIGDTESESSGGWSYSHATDLLYFRADNANQMEVGASNIRPAVDNTTLLGTATRRWSTVYAGSGTIATSDAREKQQVALITVAEQAVAVRLKGLLRSFKFNSAVALKGNAARIHFGVMAQDVKAAFEAEGLVAEQYAMFCYDTWPDEFDGGGNLVQVGGNRYGIRYEELLAFILAAL
jgi:hypothetical protein